MRSKVLFVLLAVLTSLAHADDRSDLLKVREAVWRAWFADDARALRELVPADTLVISSGEEHWKNQAEIFAAASEFRNDGGKLIKLEFPRTEIQWFGNVAVVYSAYSLDFEVKGKPVHETGRATEVFVKRHGKWVNPGWHTDREK